MLATTATANARVVADVEAQLGAGGIPVVTVRGGLACLAAARRHPVDVPEQRLGWLMAHLGDLPGSGIVYALTVSAAEDVAASLREAGHRVQAYTGRTDPVDRERLENSLRHNEVKALIATSALGMGFDKPDLGFVVHLGAPASPVAYYQQVGRAGRATERADVPAVAGARGRRHLAPFRLGVDAPGRPGCRGPRDVGRGVPADVDRGDRDGRRHPADPLELLLKVLDVDGAVQRVTGGWLGTGQAWTHDAERYAWVARARAAEQDQMVTYERTSECRMAFLQRTLDDESAADCGQCDTCAGVWFPTDVPDRVIRSAEDRLAQVGVAVDPRTMWPTGMDRLGVPLKGRIGPDVQAEPGESSAG